MASEAKRESNHSFTDSAIQSSSTDPPPVKPIEKDDVSTDENEVDREDSSISSEGANLTENPSEPSTVSEQSFTSDHIPSNEPKHVASDSNARKPRKSTMTRLQENELVLSIYDAFSSYRRPSSKPSLVRKLEAIDTSLDLLRKLREQLVQTEESDKSSLHDSKSSSSAISQEKSKKTSKKTGLDGEIPSNVKKKAQNKSTIPKTPFALYCLEYRDELLETDPKATASHIKSQCDAAWKALAPARQEIYISRFSRLYDPPHPLVSEPRNMLAHGEHRKTMIEASVADKGVKLPIFVDSHSAVPGAPATPDSDVMSWKISPNPKFKGDECIHQFKSIISLRSPNSRFVSVSGSENGRILAISTGSFAYLYEMDPKKWENGLSISSSSTNSGVPSIGISDPFSIERYGVKFLAAVEATSEPMMLSHTICLNSDGSSFYSADSDRYLRKWNLHTKQLEIEVKAHEETILAIAISNRSNLIATASSDRHVMIWDAKTLVPLKRLGSNGNKKLGPTDGVVCVAFSPDGNHVACGSVDHQIRVWNATSGILEARFDGHEKPVVSIAWANETNFVSSSLDGTIKYWCIKAVHTSHTFQVNLGDVAAASAFDSNEILWTGGKDKFLKYWLPSTSQSSNQSSETSSSLSSLETRGIVVGHRSSVIDMVCFPLDNPESKSHSTLLVSLDAGGICSLWIYRSISS